MRLSTYPALNSPVLLFPHLALGFRIVFLFGIAHAGNIHIPETQWGKWKLDAGGIKLRGLGLWRYSQIAWTWFVGLFCNLIAPLNGLNGNEKAGCRLGD